MSKKIARLNAKRRPPLKTSDLAALKFKPWKWRPGEMPSGVKLQKRAGCLFTAAVIMEWNKAELARRLRQIIKQSGAADVRTLIGLLKSTGDYFEAQSDLCRGALARVHVAAAVVEETV